MAAKAARPIYPLVICDAIRVKIRDEGMVRNKAIHIAPDVRADCGKEVLGLGSSRMKVPSSGYGS